MGDRGVDTREQGRERPSHTLESVKGMKVRNSVQKEQERDHLSIAEGWPLLLRISPTGFLSATLGWLTLAWGMFLAVDIWGVIDLGTSLPVWYWLFNDRPIEWTQWFFLVFATVAAAYLAGRLYADRRVMASHFFFLLAIGLGFMLIEDAGDIRHVISAIALSLFESEESGLVLGIPYRVVSDVPYFAALAAVPVYAVLRYGRHIWESVRTRWFLASGILVYAIAAMGSAVSHFNEFYIRTGAWLDAIVFAHGFPVPEHMSQGETHFLLMDAVIEESVELLALAMILAAILAFVSDVRADRIAGK